MTVIAAAAAGAFHPTFGHSRIQKPPTEAKVTMIGFVETVSPSQTVEGVLAQKT